jgi:hypothetical protein
MMPGVVRLAPLKSTVCRLRGTPDPRRPLSSLARFDLAQRTGTGCPRQLPKHKSTGMYSILIKISVVIFF